MTALGLLIVGISSASWLEWIQMKCVRGLSSDWHWASDRCCHVDMEVNRRISTDRSKHIPMHVRNAAGGFNNDDGTERVGEIINSDGSRTEFDLPVEREERSVGVGLSKWELDILISALIDMCVESIYMDALIDRLSDARDALVMYD